mgnify:CR=1 FL=1
MPARLTLYTTRAVHTIYFGDNLEVLRSHVPDGAAALIYIDPPFNTGRAQARTRIKTVRSVSGDRVGFKGQRYDTVKMGSRAYPDRFDNYLEFLEPRLREAYRALAPDGTLYFHIDYREVHYCKVLLDGIFGRDSFLNEIIWAYDYGGRPTRRWPPKHDNILVYVKDPRATSSTPRPWSAFPTWRRASSGRRRRRGASCPPTRGGTPSCPPRGASAPAIRRRSRWASSGGSCRRSSRPGDLVLDFFAGSGTTGEACLETNRRFLLVDANPEALDVMARRFHGVRGVRWVGYDPRTAAAQRGAAGGPVA